MDKETQYQNLQDKLVVDAVDCPMCHVVVGDYCLTHEQQVAQVCHTARVTAHRVFISEGIASQENLDLTGGSMSKQQYIVIDKSLIGGGETTMIFKSLKDIEKHYTTEHLKKYGGGVKGIRIYELGAELVPTMEMTWEKCETTGK